MFGGSDGRPSMLVLEMHRLVKFLERASLHANSCEHQELQKLLPDGQLMQSVKQVFTVH
jgi:hypothetical protein